MVTKPLSNLAGTSELGDRGKGEEEEEEEELEGNISNNCFKNTKKKCVYNEIRSPFAKKNP